MAWAVLYERDGKRFSVPEVTRGLVNDFKYAKKYGLNEVIGVTGGFGEGKSEDAQRLGLLWTGLTGGKMQISFDIDEVPALSYGDFNILDEYIIPEGPGRNQAIQRFWNLVSVTRIDLIYHCLNCHTMPRIAFLVFRLETYLQNREDQLNLVRVTVPLPEKDIYIGNAIIPLHHDETIRQEYVARKHARVAALIKTKGKKTIGDKVDFETAAQIVIAEATKRGWILKNLTQASAMIDMLAKREGWDVNYNTETKLAALITLEAGKLQREKNGKFHSSRPYIGQTAALRQAVIDCLIDNYGIDREDIDMLMEYAAGEKQADIAKRRPGLTQPDVSDRLDPIRSKALGYAFEDVYAAKLRGETKLVVAQYGKNSEEPDILIVDETGQVVTVYSVKCYFDKKRVTTIPRDELARKELAFYEAGYPLKLVYLDFITDKLFLVDVANQDRFSFEK
jgi:hypothetical protein